MAMRKHRMMGLFAVGLGALLALGAGCVAETGDSGAEDVAWDVGKEPQGPWFECPDRAEECTAYCASLGNFFWDGKCYELSDMCACRPTP
jgi:hypothetical protein